ncbi:hypothetical protein HDK77DRAFT_100184 [Phyllosticta capitalensis]|uniref:uncharacterized protein n=1 Tax=Phyllosticta capitalensis TaxID=121624 RepID=UPI00313122BB
MHCQIHGASTASCRCHKCQSLLCIACWSDHCLDVHGNYPAELDIPHGQEDQSRMRTTGSSNLRTSVSASWQADRKGGPSERQSQQPRSSSPSPKATERTTSTSSRVIFTPASSRHSDMDYCYAGREQQGRASGTARDGATGRARSQSHMDSILAGYLKDEEQPWSPYALRSDKKESSPGVERTR